MSMGLTLSDGAYSNLIKYQQSIVWQNNHTKLNETNMNSMQQLIRIAGNQLFNGDSKDTLYHRLNRLQYEMVGNYYISELGSTAPIDDFRNNIGVLARTDQLLQAVFNCSTSPGAGDEAPKMYTYTFGLICPESADSPILYKIWDPNDFSTTKYNDPRQFTSYREKSISGWNGIINGNWNGTTGAGLLSEMVNTTNVIIDNLNKQFSTYRPGAIMAKGSSSDIPLLMWKQDGDTTYNFTHGNALLHTSVRMNYLSTAANNYLKGNVPYNSIITYGDSNDSNTPNSDTFVSEQNDGGILTYNYQYNRHTTKAIEDVVDTGFNVVTTAINNRTSRYNGYFSCLADKELILSEPSMGLSIKNIKGNYTASGVVYVEVGATPPIAYKFVCNPGKYKYNPGGYLPEEGRATEVTFSNYNVTVSSSNGSSMSGGQQEGTMTWGSTLSDGETLTFEASTNHSDGCSAYNNLGQLKSDDDLIIKGKGLTATREIQAYRKVFYGSSTLDVSNSLSSNFIRGLQSTDNPSTKGRSIAIDVPSGTRSVVFAYPASLGRLAEVIDYNAMKSNIVGNMIIKTVKVNAADLSAPIDYYVYYIVHGAVTGQANTYTVKI